MVTSNPEELHDSPISFLRLWIQFNHVKDHLCQVAAEHREKFGNPEIWLPKSELACSVFDDDDDGRILS